MSTFEALEELAKDRSQDGRRELLRVLTDMFLQNSDVVEGHASDNYSDIVERVLDDVVEEVRAEFSERVARETKLPRPIVLKLAWDDFDVASPVLEYSPLLTDADLVEVATDKSDGHLMAISRRAELHALVTNILVDRGDEEVIHSVAANPGAEFSDHGYDALANKAKLDEKLQETLVGRPDVPQEFAAQLEPFLSDQLKKRLAIRLDPAKEDVGSLVGRDQGAG
jgi:uncharacterized protein (DUF2336 family)